MCWTVISCFSRVRLFVTPWTVAHQAPLSIEFSMQEYWSGLPCLCNLCLMSPALAGGFLTASATWEARVYVCACMCVCSPCVYTFERKKILKTQIGAN